MQEKFTTLSSNGQVVIPAEVRKTLGIEAGTKVAVRVEEGRVILEPITASYIRSLRGSLKGPLSMVTVRDREHRLEK